MKTTIGNVSVKTETASALLVVINNQDRWVPKSVIDDDSEIWSSKEGQNSGKLVVAEWWAEKNL